MNVGDTIPAEFAAEELSSGSHRVVEGLTSPGESGYPHNTPQDSKRLTIERD